MTEPLTQHFSEAIVKVFVSAVYGVHQVKSTLQYMHKDVLQNPRSRCENLLFYKTKLS